MAVDTPVLYTRHVPGQAEQPVGITPVRFCLDHPARHSLGVFPVAAVVQEALEGEIVGIGQGQFDSGHGGFRAPIRKGGVRNVFENNSTVKTVRTPLEPDS